MITAREFLVSTFGDGALLIDQINVFGDTTISGASFVIDQKSDGTNYCAFTTCGGEAIICLERRHTIDKRPMYIVLNRDDERRVVALRNAAQGKSQEDCDNMTKEDWAAFHKPTPFPIMRLVQSA